ncbi:MAG TPA: hypothetical protein VNC39_01455 [Acidocella sp.]|jgi:hypothetical protein|uniref:hypothetical protein n=1 Tax=Acidocella sp. TaxID=50710 RepID=UPI002CAC83B3|nr:hypothetical protein [Acidocella sp.]HVE20616.1 hypothetical protein [Acidocella sp.]
MSESDKRPKSISVQAESPDGTKKWFTGFTADEWRKDRDECIARFVTWVDAIIPDTKDIT